ncbi:hypothetical protein DCAR_0415279 [Daucus carota subsp. sativus]|uniref:Uncharacterized protein n=1 Tax=Daucus carota subsp. sativus TaxID=79200 RepID=A0A165A9U9_DAUCS|nr:hypothetical protein DCAR_0415279 [Daucus carota subsp. sativus]
MDHPTPPTAALQNLTIADSPCIPTTPLENLTISATNTEKSTPRKVLTHTKPSREESFRRAHLTAMTRQWYGPAKASPSPIRIEDPSTSRPSNVASAEERLDQLRVHASKPWLNREGFNSLRLAYVRRRVIGELSSMAKKKPKHRDKLELAVRYVQRRENREEVLSIIQSLFN